MLEVLEAIQWWIKFSLILVKIGPTSNLRSLFVTSVFFHLVPMEA